MRAPKSFEEGMNRLEAILDQMQQPQRPVPEKPLAFFVIQIYPDHRTHISPSRTEKNSLYIHIDNDIIPESMVK